jgi:copper chaperone NosL
MNRTGYLLLALVVACGVAGPMALGWGTDQCAHCHMTLADRKFGAEIVTTRGRALPFDDAGCAAKHLVTAATPADEVSSVWVVDYTRPDSLIAADGAVYVRSAAFHTPMGSGIVAVPDSATAAALAAELQGSVHTWRDVQIMAAHGAFDPR